MKVNKLIDKKFHSVSVLEDTRDIMEWFKTCSYLAVEDDEGNIVGIITHQDLIRQPECRAVIDCNFIKPKVTPENTLLQVQKLMAEADTDVLPVYENRVFLGTISLKDVADRLAVIISENQQTYQKVVHDLRNPLSNIQGLTFLLADSVTEDNEIRELIDLCKHSSKHMADILDDLIFVELDENKALNKEPTELNAFFKECISEMQVLCQLKHIELVNVISDKKIIKRIDKNQLKRAIQNVLSNAIKFSYPNSSIKVGSMIGGDKVTLKITDSGIGIPGDLQPYVFDKFTQARRPGTNNEPTTGLGLCFSKQSIERHQGSIRFTSTKAKGTIFYITL
ncbi:MAG: ATP-binding protein [Mucilaginibacter sp.]|uniref:ATP-binding protein n=1 Tax=Mucilaginibacter sp. TaxID=1882438 RepID=UPI0031A29B26